jgi:hypothetical protein
MLFFRLDYFGLTGVYFELLGGAKLFWSCAKKKLVSIFFFCVVNLDLFYCY